MSRMNKNWTLILTLIALLGLGACASQAPGTQPDDMSVEEHKKHAQKHEQVSEEHQDHFDPGANVPHTKPPGERARQLYPLETYNPTEPHQELAQQHRQHAEQHRKAAQKLQAYEEKHCAKFPEATRAACPLMGQIETVEDIEGGARITFYEDVPRQAAIEHMRCHFAFARAEGYEGMDTCPLYLEGISVEPLGDGQTVTLTTDNPAQVEALRTRSRAHLSE